MSSLERRLNKLQMIVGAMGCPTCKPWHRTRVQIIAPASTGPPADPLAAAAVDRPPPPPPRCPDCGRAIPRQTVVQIIAQEPEGDENPEVAI